MKKSNLSHMTQLALLLAIQIVLTFTPLGFITIQPVAITLLHLPVLIGSLLLGYKSAAFLGTTFGVLSMVRAATSGAIADILFNPLASGNPIGSIVMAVLPRIVFAILAVFLYNLLKDKLNDTLAIGISAGVSTVVHSFGVLGLMSIFFSAFPLKDVFAIIISINCLLEILAAVIVVTAVCKGMFIALGKKKN